MGTAAAEKIPRISDFDNLEEFERQTALRGNKRTKHQRGPGHKFGWEVSPNIARASAAREKLPPKPPPVPINAASPIAAIAPSMTEVLKIIVSYDDLVNAVRDRCDEMGMTRAELNHQSGLTDGHAEKLLCHSHLKRFGMRSLELVLGGIGCRLALIEDPAQAAKIRGRMTPRERPIRTPAQPSVQQPPPTSRHQRVTSQR